MKSKNKQTCLTISMLMLAILISCSKADVKKEISNNCNPVTTEFVQELEDFEYFIEAEIKDNLVRYPQVNYEWTNVSNKYFVDSQETWLQAYNSSSNAEGSWRIRFSDIDIENIALPFKFDSNQARVTWFDSRIDQIIKNTDFCQGVDNGCIFSLESSNLNNSIQINKVSNQIIEGTFNGKAILIRTGIYVGQDTSKCYEITNGNFKINYRKE